METPIQYVLVSIISISILLTIVNAIRSYRRLSHIPGPPLAAVSRLWMLKSLLGPRTHNLYEACLKYGTLARVGPNELVTSDPDLVRHMHANRSPCVRSPHYRAYRFKPGADNILSETDEHRHQDLRNNMASGYAGKENPGLESEIDERIRDLVNLVDRKYIYTTGESGRQMDFARKAQSFTVDIISGLAFDQLFENLTFDEDKYEYMKSTEEAMPVTILITELIKVRSFLEKSSLIKMLVLSARDKIRFNKIIGLTKEKVAERFGDNKKVKQNILRSFLSHGLSQDDTALETVLQLLASEPPKIIC